jgi:hypothetical protein
MANYDYNRVKEIADEIIEKIGVEHLYTDVNFKYENAPKNFLVKDTEVFIYFMKDHLEKIGTPKQIHIIDCEHVNRIYGAYVKMAENIYIVFIHPISDCWKRFTTIKELCSCYIGHYQDDVINNTIYENEQDYLKGAEEAFWNKVTYVNSEGLKEGDIDSETFAIMVASEIMISKPYREITERLIAQIKDESIKLNDVAKSLLIPESVLKFYRMKNLL